MLIDVRLKLEDDVRKALAPYVACEITHNHIDLQGLSLDVVVEETVELILANIDGDLCRNTLSTVTAIKERNEENA